MLPRVNRLKKGRAFEWVKKNGTLCQSANFGVFMLKREDGDPPRFGFVVSSKISKAAVHRNRILRAFRESVRQNLKFIPAGHDYVFLAKKNILSMTTNEIMTEALEFLKKEVFVK